MDDELIDYGWWAERIHVARRGLRNAEGSELSQAEAAALADISARRWQDWERPRDRTTPWDASNLRDWRTLVHLIKICIVLGISRRELEEHLPPSIGRYVQPAWQEAVTALTDYYHRLAIQRRDLLKQGEAQLEPATQATSEPGTAPRAPGGRGRANRQGGG